MVEYPALIYRKNRQKGYVANCFIENVLGFGKTEEEAINNLEKILQKWTKKINIKVRPIKGSTLL